MVLLLAVVAMPVLLRFFSWTGAAVAGAGGGSAFVGAAGAAALYSSGALPRGHPGRRRGRHRPRLDHPTQHPAPDRGGTRRRSGSGQGLPVRRVRGWARRGRRWPPAPPPPRPPGSGMTAGEPDDGADS